MANNLNSPAAIAKFLGLRPAIMLSAEELARAHKEAQDLGNSSKALLLRQCIEDNVHLWGEDPREYTEKEAAYVSRLLAIQGESPDVMIQAD